MEIFFKNRETGEVTTLPYNEFKDGIRKGEVLPQDEVQDRVLTNNEWRTVDNLRIFHKLSPDRYPSGPYLAARERAEAERDRLSEECRIQEAAQEALAREFFKPANAESGFMLRCLYRFLIECREAPLTCDEFAVRFTYLPSFHPSLFVRASHHGGKWELSCRAQNGPTINHLPLAPEDGRRLLSLAEAVNLAAMPVDDDVLGLDGSTWALEACCSGGHAFRHRWSPAHDTEKRALTEFVALSRYLVKLSGLGPTVGELN